MTTRLTSFDSELPEAGTHVIEASAGTGKTYQLATLTVRYLIETDIVASQILLVTFTNEAAGELRHRVRHRLTGLIAALQSNRSNGDEYTERLLARTDQAQLIAKLETALQTLDEASISTIHGFSQQLIAGAGLAGNPDVALRADLSELETAVIANNLTERAVRDMRDPIALPTTRAVVGGLRKGRNQPGIRIEPNLAEGEARREALEQALALLEQTDGQPDDLDSEISLEILGLWKRAGTSETLMSNRTKKDPRDKVKAAIDEIQKNVVAAQIVRESLVEITEHLDAASELGFNDLLVEAAALVESPEILDQLQQRFRLVLVDEFQDTDPTQWKMLSGICTPTSSRPAPALIAVGDPKQAIYRFRGGNITTYQQATQSADAKDTLDTNWRSTTSMVDALNHVFQGTNFGGDIVYEPVMASGHVRQDSAVPVVVRTVEVGAKVDDQRSAIANDLANLISETVATTHGTDSPIRHRDIAVLYRAHDHGPQILNALKRRGIPAVIMRGETVLASAAVDWWRALFWALERPSDSGRVKAVALTPFFRMTTAEMVVDDHRVRELQTELLGLALTLERQGVSHLVQQLLRAGRRTLNFAALPDGERALVDVVHLGELLHLASQGEPLSAHAARQALDELAFTDPEDVDYANELTKVRLDTETDDDVVRIMSVHAAKGLEFEMVCCPTLWTGVTASPPYDYIDGDTPVLHFAKKEFAPEASEASRREDLDESARLTYVALTRPVRRLVLWWPITEKGPTTKKNKAGDPKNGMDQLMHQRAEALGVAASTPVVLEALATAEPDLVIFERADTTAPGNFASDARPVDATSGNEALTHAEAGRVFDRTAERLSFSQIAGVAFPYDDRHRHSPPDPDQPEDSGSVDESPDEALDALPTVTDNDVPLAELPAGKDAGTRLHTIFENIDFAEAPEARLRSIGEQVTLQFPAIETELHGRVVEGLDAVLATPMGSSTGQLSLADITFADRLDEMQFDLPMRSGHNNAATLPELAELVRDHTSDFDEHASLLRAWADELSAPRETRRLGGFLTGSIDLLFRRPVDATHRYFVADYKSNRVAVWPDPLVDAVYAPERLGAEMLHGHYLMQALLYLVATNRFLKLRVADYDADVHLGPALYLFVRGMTGALTNAEPHGVFSWRPSTDLIEAADALLLEPMHRPGRAP